MQWKIQNNCLGCQLANDPEIEKYIVLSDSIVTCILDIDPVSPGHVLILPKTHCTSVLDAPGQTMSGVWRAARTLMHAIQTQFNPDGITLVQTSGIFDELQHFHLHVVPRWSTDGFWWGTPETGTSPPDFAVIRARLHDAVTTGNP